MLISYARLLGFVPTAPPGLARMVDELGHSMGTDALVAAALQRLLGWRRDRPEGKAEVMWRYVDQAIALSDFYGRLGQADRCELHGIVSQLIDLGPEMAAFEAEGEGAAARRRAHTAPAAEARRRQGEITRSRVRPEVAAIIRDCPNFKDAKVRSTLIGRLTKDHPFAKLDRKVQIKHIAAIRAELDAERVAEGYDRDARSNFVP